MTSLDGVESGRDVVSGGVKLQRVPSASSAGARRWRHASPHTSRYVLRDVNPCHFNFILSRALSMAMTRRDSTNGMSTVCSARTQKRRESSPHDNATMT
jgi:hypothetical protein